MNVNLMSSVFCEKRVPLEARVLLIQATNLGEFQNVREKHSKTFIFVVVLITWPFYRNKIHCHVNKSCKVLQPGTSKKVADYQDHAQKVVFRQMSCNSRLTSLFCHVTFLQKYVLLFSQDCIWKILILPDNVWLVFHNHFPITLLPCDILKRQ